MAPIGDFEGVVIREFTGRESFNAGAASSERRRSAPGAVQYARARRRRRPLLHGLILGLIAVGALLTFYFPQALTADGGDPAFASVSGLAVPSIGVSRQDEPVLTSSVLTDTVRRDEMEDGLNVLAGETATPEQEDEEEQIAAVAPFQLYAVVEGDTASSIAAQFGIDLQYLLAANPEISDGESLIVGQMLIIPSANGILYQVRYGETLSDVAARYGVTVEDILGWPGNGLASADQVTENQLVFVPNGIPPASFVPEPTDEPEVFVSAPPTEEPAPPPAAAAEQPPPAPVASTGLVWPVGGPISSYMDGSHPLGIDIDLYNNPFAGIVAATSGTVTFAGGSPCCSYGYYIVIVSPDGIETLYAHLSSIAVSVGQTVSQGQYIGDAGCTGYCTGNHLHFEVLDNGVRVNPLNYLP
jgi:murein DD-endopeptidase MepM/ murein hydrolase activator NlpD